jgi:hypothetical protein
MIFNIKLAFCCIKFSLIGANSSVLLNDTSDIKLALDNMSIHFNEGTEFDQNYFNKLVKCMSKYDDMISI